ncbi:MAG: hypothetical protein CMI29_05800, partial [Opitutae bacterium]|nr:hypothetical protein [Opitutae bacterium]
MHLPASSNRPSASNSIIRKILSARFLSAGCLVLGSLFEPMLQGAVTVERWEDIRGHSVVNLIQSSAYPQSPSSTAVIDTFSTPRSGDSYGQRLR